MAVVKESDSGYTVDSGYRAIADGIYFMKECIVSSAIDREGEDGLPEWYDPGEELHTSQNSYLIVSDDTLLFDTWSPASRDEVLDTMEAMLDGRDLDYLALSHFESNHAGNTEAILREYPDATLVVPRRGTHHDLYTLDRWETMSVDDGDVIDLGDQTVEFVEPAFFDQAATTYAFERTTRTLFTVDWFGFQHMASECLSFLDEMEHDLSPDQLDRFTGYALVWLRFADPEKTDAVIDHIKDDIDPSVIAPAHGQIIREDVPKYLDMMKEVIRAIAEEGVDYHIHSHQMSRYEPGGIQS